MRLVFPLTLMGQPLILGPAPWFKVDHGAIKMGPTDALIGQYDEHQWTIGVTHFTRFDVDREATVHFEAADHAASKPLGPFHDVSFNDGSIWADNKLIATFDEATRCWTVSREGACWPVLVLVAAYEREIRTGARRLS